MDFPKVHLEKVSEFSVEFQSLQSFHEERRREKKEGREGGKEGKEEERDWGIE